MDTAQTTVSDPSFGNLSTTQTTAALAFGNAETMQTTANSLSFSKEDRGFVIAVINVSHNRPVKYHLFKNSYPDSSDHPPSQSKRHPP